MSTAARKKPNKTTQENKWLQARELSMSLNNVLREILESIEPEDNSGNLTGEYLRATTALMGCKRVMERVDGDI